jgi:precorrin-2 dehydrogenase / sirohydrochlorin ferrochelatase
MILYPITLDIRNRLCLLIGGGDVASRKIDPLLACGARIRVVSPEVCAAVRELAGSGRIEWLQRGYRTGDLRGAFLVFAVTDNRDVQRLVTREAKESGILINNADNQEMCTFQVPAAVRQGDLLLTVSTGGGSPALAALIKKSLEREYGPEYGFLVCLLASIRGTVVGDGDAPWLHKRLFEQILEMGVLSCIRERDWLSLKDKLTAILPATINVSELVEDLAVKILGMKDNGESCGKPDRSAA